MTSLHETLLVVLIGCGATLLMDLWMLLLNRLGVQTLNFAYLGRWLGHLRHGRVMHAAIARAAPIAYELQLGWLAHYAIGIAFTVGLVGLAGPGWIAAPSLAPAMGLGLATVAFPLLLMQPAMGMGIAASRTPTPLRNSLRSIANHAVFGLGLFLSASAIAWVSR